MMDLKSGVACYFWIFPYTTKVIRVRLNMTTIFVFSVKLICNAIDFMSILSCCSSPVKVDMPPTMVSSRADREHLHVAAGPCLPCFCVVLPFVCLLYVCLSVLVCEFITRPNGSGPRAHPKQITMAYIISKYHF